MIRKTLTIVLCCISLSAMAINNYTLLKADNAYNTGNISDLGSIFSKNHNNMVIKYLYAKAILTKNISTYAESFIAQSPDNYMRNDLIHQLLIFYYDNNPTSYNRIFKLLKINQTSLNEKCGFAVTNSLAINNKILPDINWLVNNKPPLWCVDWIKTVFNNNQITTKELDLMLYNLITNDQRDIYNQIAKQLSLHPINFYHYRNSKINDLPYNNDYKYLAVYRVTDIVYKNPDSAYDQMNRAKLDTDTKNFLGNFIAMNYAMKHDFNTAILLYDKYYTDNLRDDEYEWRIRSYMYYGKWDEVINSIDDMPKSLQTKNVWLYWRARANSYTNRESQAINFYSQIPNDYSYYSMLAHGILHKTAIFTTQSPPITKLSSNQYVTSAKEALQLYLVGKNMGSKNLVTIAAAQWNYAAKQAQNNDLLAMSNLSYSQKFYDLSIFAANQMDKRYLSLSFPTPFLNIYNKYANSNNIDVSYVLAISRQESRFNASAIAIDGGIGLMQIMPNTATYITKKSGYRNCSSKTPECNIKLGSWFLGNLYKKFDNNFIYSTAGYNAGPSRVIQWKNILGKLDNTIQIELIPIAITRDYVQKVLVNKAIYDAKFKKPSNINFYSYIKNLNLKTDIAQ